MRKTKAMEPMVMEAIIEGWGSLDNLYDDMREDVDTVMVNLEDMVDCEFDMDEISDMVYGTIYGIDKVY